MEDTQFRQLLDRFRFSWTGYRRVRKGVKKRLARHMHEIHCWNIGEYIEAIESDIYILATDMSPEYLDRAKTAVYPRSSMREVPKVIRSTYFETFARGRYALRSWMRDGIVWQVHNLLSDPHRIAFDLIFLRNNLLTYYVDEVKIPAITRIVNSLAPGGFLIIGSHERMPNEAVDLKPWRESTVIFQKQYLNTDKEQ